MGGEIPGQLPPAPAGIERPRLSVERTLRATWSVYREHLGPVLAATAIVAVPVLVAQVALGGRLLGRLVDIVGEAGSTQELVDGLLASAAILGTDAIGFFAIPFLAWPLLVGSLSALVGRARGGGRVDLQPVLAAGLSAYPALLAASVLVSVPVVLWLVAVGGLTFLVIGSVASVGFLVVPATLAGFGAATLGLVYVGIRWAVVAPAVVIDGLGPLEALRRSWWLTQGNLWRVLVAVVLLALAVGMARQLVEALLDVIVGALPGDPLAPTLVLALVPAVAFPAFDPILRALLLLALEGSPDLIADRPYVG